MAAEPQGIPVDHSAIPSELMGYRNWVCWRWKPSKSRWTKVPINARTGNLASSISSSTWSTYEEACQGCQRFNLPGIGFVFSEHDPYAGVDLDGCYDPKTGKIEPWAEEIIRGLNSYTEVSPSGLGLKVFVRGRLPGARRREGQIEMYDWGRFFTVTGAHLTTTPSAIQDRPEQLASLYRATFGEERQSSPARHAVASDLNDQDVLVRAAAAKNGAKFSSLWSGDIGAYPSHSEADLALCSLLAFWCGPDESQIDRLFRQSGLYRDKWEREDYRTSTITEALDRTEFYEAPSTAKIIWMTGGEPEAEPRPWIVEITDFLHEELPPERWDVEGLFRRETVNLVVGPPKTFKSFFVQEAAVALAAGMPMFGVYAVPEPRRVIYVQEESSRAALHRRLASVLKGHDMLPSSIKDQLYVVTNQGFLLDDAGEVDRLVREGITRYDADVVIFDPLREVHNQDENSSKEMRPVLQVMKRIRDQFGVTIIVVHHNNKNPEYDNPEDSIRGTTSIWGAMDGGIFVAKTKEARQVKVNVTLKEGAQIAPFFYTIHGSDDEIFLEVFDIEESKQGPSDSSIVAAVDRLGWCDLSEIGNEVQLSERRLRPRINGLVSRGLLRRREVPTGRTKRHLYGTPEMRDDDPHF